MPYRLRGTAIRKQRRFRTWLPTCALARQTYSGLTHEEQLFIFDTFEVSKSKRKSYHSKSCAQLTNDSNRALCNVCFPAVVAPLPLCCKNCRTNWCKRCYAEVYTYNLQQWQWSCRLWGTGSAFLALPIEVLRTRPQTRSANL